jgi:hypothetical protein
MTNLTAEEFITKEFEDFNFMSPNDWLRKMKEFSIINNHGLDLSHLEKLNYKEKNAFKSALSKLYFNDKSDYKMGLMEVVMYLGEFESSEIDEDTIKIMYGFLNPE